MKTFSQLGDAVRAARNDSKSEQRNDNGGEGGCSRTTREGETIPARKAATVLILPVPALIDRSVTPVRATERAVGPTHAGANAEALAMHATPAHR
jgi:hypothetical protein